MNSNRTTMSIKGGHSFGVNQQMPANIINFEKIPLFSQELSHMDRKLAKVGRQAYYHMSFDVGCNTVLIQLFSHIQLWTAQCNKK